MVKKQDQLEAEVHQHSSHIEATIAQGEALIRGGHKAAMQIKAKCEQVGLSIGFSTNSSCCPNRRR